MLHTLLCIQHFLLVSCLHRNGWASAPIEFFIDTGPDIPCHPTDLQPTHVHFYLARKDARILFGRLPLPIRDKIRSMHTVSFQPEIDAATPWQLDQENTCHNCYLDPKYEYDDPKLYNYVMPPAANYHRINEGKIRVCAHCHPDKPDPERLPQSCRSCADPLPEGQKVLCRYCAPPDRDNPYLQWMYEN